MTDERAIDFSSLVGQVFTDIQRDDDVITFGAALEGKLFVMRHDQDCCENVYIEDIVGDLSDLLFTPILVAEEATNRKEDENGESCTWTFYKLATAKGYVDIRWCGSSNGYYSESVTLYEQTP